MGSDAVADAAAARIHGEPSSHPSADLIVRAEPFDAPAAQALVAELMRELEERYEADGPADGDDHETAGAWAVRPEQVAPTRGVFVVARLGGVPVGYGAIRRLVETSTGHLVSDHGAAVDPPTPGASTLGEIKRMYTVPAARRRGVSRALLARLEVEAARLGYRRLQLETGGRQPEAIALYETAGYHRIPTYGQYEGDELSICFAKDL